MHEVETLDLMDYLDVLRRRYRLVVSTVFLVVLVAVGITFIQTPVYEAEAQIALRPAGPIANTPMSYWISNQELMTEREVIQGPLVATGAAESLEWPGSIEDLASRVSVTVVPDTHVIQIAGRADDPQLAAAIADAFTRAYLDHRRQGGLEWAAASIADLERRAEVMRDQLHDTDQLIARASSEQAETLGRQRQALITDLGSLTSQIASLRAVSESHLGTGQVIRPATPPRTPIAPRPGRNAALALVLGGMLGVGIAFLRDTLDQSIRTDEEAVRATARPVLGHVPRSETDEVPTDRLVTLLAPISPRAEAYRALYANLRFVLAGETSRSLLVTSAEQGEGKTTTAANLAVAAASAGTRTLLVGFDFRRPNLHRLFGISGSVGLSTHLSGEHDLSDVVFDVGVSRLRIIPGGPVPPNPSELMTSPRMVELLRKMAATSDLVIYDGPPLLALADALQIAPMVSGSLLVLDFNTSTRRAVSSAADRIRGVGGQLFGTVINRVDKSSSYYSYYYESDYNVVIDDDDEPQSSNGQPDLADAQAGDRRPWTWGS